MKLQGFSHDLLLNEEGILVLGIRRTDASYVGTPSGETEIEAGDTLILYGRDRSIKDLDERESDHVGDISHKKAAEEQKEVVKEQERVENVRKMKKSYANEDKKEEIPE